MRHHVNMQGAQETEVKISVGDVVQMRERLSRNGFRPSVDRAFEANTLFDRPDGELKQSQMLLRLRQVGHRYILTWKGPDKPGPHKSRPELETTVGEFATMQSILERLNFRPMFRYEKYRTEFQHPDRPEGVVTLDETPIGNFLELEGPGAWIDEIAVCLGFDQNDYILESYGRLYLADCERRSIQPGNMTFNQE